MLLKFGATLPFYYLLLSHCAAVMATTHYPILKAMHPSITVCSQASSHPDASLNNGPSTLVNIYYHPLNTSADSVAQPMTGTESDPKGLYELPLQTGAYCLCSGWEDRTSISVPVNRPIKVDYTMSNAEF